MFLGHPVQRDLLTSFDTPQSKNNKNTLLPRQSESDLMGFASPISKLRIYV